MNTLFFLIEERVIRMRPGVERRTLEYRPFRDGDVRHPQADIGKISDLLGYMPTHRVDAGLDEATSYYLAPLDGRAKS